MNSTVTPASQVLAVLDDAAAGAVALELSSALARALQRELVVVYIESAPALFAAELPFTRVLAHGGRQWLPLQPGDVEQGFRTHAARLRELAARIAGRQAVTWSLRVMRGSLLHAATELRGESDLVLMSNAPAAMPPAAPTAGRARASARRPVVSVLRDGSAAGEHAFTIAGQLAQALSGAVETAPAANMATPAGLASTLAALARSDVAVLPRGQLEPAALALLRCPVLLVG